MAGRVTQRHIEVVVDVDGTAGRVTQRHVEVAVTNAAAAGRVTQRHIEVAVAVVSPKASGFFSDGG